MKCPLCMSETYLWKFGVSKHYLRDHELIINHDEIPEEFNNSSNDWRPGDYARIINGPNKGKFGKIIDLYITDEFSTIYQLEEFIQEGDTTKVYHVTKDEIELEPMYKTIPYFFEIDYDYLFNTIILGQQTNISENIEKYKGYLTMFYSIYDTINRSNEAEWNDLSLVELLNDIPFNYKPKILIKNRDYNIYHKENLDRVKIKKENIDEIKSLLLDEIQSLKQTLNYMSENEKEILKIRSDISILLSNKDAWTKKDKIIIEKIYEYFYGKKAQDSIVVDTEGKDSWGFDEEANKIEINLKKTTDIRLLEEALTKAGIFQKSSHYTYRKYLNPTEVNVINEIVY